MLEKPDIPETLILSSLGESYGLRADRMTFLPLGVDVNAAAYRVEARGGEVFFLKLRRGTFDGRVAEVPHYLKNGGVDAVVAPLQTSAGRLWAEMGEYRLLLYPFIAGQDGYQQELSARQWQAFGTAMKAIHTARLPAALRVRIPREGFLPRFREQTRTFQALVEERSFEEPAADKLAAFMRAERAEISRVVGLAEELGLALRARPPEAVLCHADLHPGNLLLGANDALTIVDWDAPCYAPKERDLMFAGDPGSREAELFFRGYGPAEIDPRALAYFHYERIVEDFAAYGEQLLLSPEGGEDREQAYQYFISNFQPGGIIARADRAYRLISN